MSESDKQNLPGEREGLTVPSYKVTKVMHDDEGVSEETGVPLRRLIQIVKLSRPHTIRIGREDRYLETDHVMYERYTIERTKPNGDKYMYTETSLWASEEDGTLVPNAVLYFTTTDYDLDYAMFAIGEI